MLTTNQNLQQGRYRIISQIRQNAEEASYEAFDNLHGANVLLREVRDDVGKIATATQIDARKTSFANNAKALTEIKHPSVLQVKEFFSEIDHHYLVTEFPAGGSPVELMEKNEAPFPVGDVAEWTYGLLDALNYLHRLAPPLVHGEIRPQNVCLTADGKAKLIVFNLVKNTDEASASRRPPSRNQMFDAAALPYLALEQIWQGLDAASKKVILTNYDDQSERILEQPSDARTDVFSLAATVYYFLTGQPPVDTLTRSIDILEGKADPLQSPSRLNSYVPAEVSDVLVKALEIRRENRFSSAIIMSQVLRTAFVRSKEREAAASSTAATAAPSSTAAVRTFAVDPARTDDEAFLEIPSAEPKKMAAPPQNLEIEAEQARQLELIKRQLREAEARRQQAEKRAAEAEKRLLEAEKNSVAIEPAAESAEKAAAENAKIEKTSSAPAILPETPPEIRAEIFTETPAAVEPPVAETRVSETPVSETPAAERSVYESSDADDFPSLFAAQPKEGGAFKKVAAAAVVLLVLGGAGFGIWTMSEAKTGETLPPVSTTSAAVPASQPVVEETKTEPVSQPTPETIEQTSVETTPADTSPTETSVPAANPASGGAFKPKAVVAATPPQMAQTKKPTPNPVKKAEPPKKVTLDDLLKDN